MNEFVYNVMNSAAKTIQSLKARPFFLQSDLVIVSDEHEISYHLCGAAEILKKAENDTEVHLIVNGKPMDEAFARELSGLLEENTNFHIWKSLEEYFAYQNGKENKIPEIFIDVVNLRLPVYSMEDPGKAAYQKKAGEIRRILDHNRELEENAFHLLTCIPDITEALPEVTHAVAEREYEVIFREAAENSPERYVSDFENLVRSYRDMLDRVQVIRMDRVFGPGILCDDGAGVIPVLKSIKEDHSVTLYDKDRFDFYSASYIRDAVASILLAVAQGRKGNIYHVSSWEISRFQIISNIYGAFPDQQISLETVHEEPGKEYKTTYRMLNARKIRLIHRNNLSKYLYTTKLNALKNTALWYFGEKDYIPKSDINVYFGRMDRIREIELDILKEVDKICKENNINYFLAAGTMLGAVRHNGFIPWDDDVDIGMLPEDYERFLKVCPEKLSVDFGYQNVSTEDTSHYIHDKIRLRNSFFSTKYSDRYQMLNGVYIDIFVYYKTSNRPFFQKLHIREIELLRKAIGIRWAVTPKKPLKYRLAFKISHKIPASWIDKLYRRVLMKYNKRNTRYRVDGGFNLRKVWAFPDEWLHGTIDGNFCGLTFPILEHYHEYLTHWYGEHYMELLPLGGRKSVHDVVRIDLGQNLFEETRHDPRFRDVDIRGELYEISKEQGESL